MRRPVLPVLEPEVMAANAAHQLRYRQTTGIRHVLWGGVLFASANASANDIYHLMNVYEEIEPEFSWMVSSLSAGAGSDFDYAIGMEDCDVRCAERAARRFAELLPTESTILVFLDWIQYELGPTGCWRRSHTN